MSAYVYIRSEPGLWTVGHYDQYEKFQPESDHGNPGDAAKRVRFLNGGAEVDQPAALRRERDLAVGAANELRAQLKLARAELDLLYGSGEADFGEIRELRARRALLEAEVQRLRVDLAQLNTDSAETVNEILLNAGDEYDGDEAADAIAVRYVRDLEAVAGRNAAGLRQMIADALTGLDVEVCDGDRTFFSVLADPADVAAKVLEEMGQQPALDSRTPWGDADTVLMQMSEKFAIVRTGTGDDDVVKVIAHGEAAPDQAGHDLYHSPACRCGHPKTVHAGADAAGRCVLRRCLCAQFEAAPPRSATAPETVALRKMAGDLQALVRDLLRTDATNADYDEYAHRAEQLHVFDADGRQPGSAGSAQ